MTVALRNFHLVQYMRLRALYLQNYRGCIMRLREQCSKWTPFDRYPSWTPESYSWGRSGLRGSGDPD